MRARVIGWKGELGRAKPARDGFQYLETRDGSLRTMYRANVCDIHGRVTGTSVVLPKQTSAIGAFHVGLNHNELTSICCFF